MFKILFLSVTFIFVLSGCSATKAVIALTKSTEHFETLPQDNRIKYEPGAKDFAEITAKQLDTAIATIEERQYRKFTQPVTIYICNSVESFTNYCVHSMAAGCVLNQRLFLSPKSFQKANVLTHELSHLHIEQQVGMIKWHSGSPAWFQEGLATYVSGGEGASKATVDDARQAIAAGKTFTPDTSGSLLSRKGAYQFGLKTNMFYRQAAMFVEYLHDLDNQKFKTLLLAIEDGVDFENAFNASYQTPIDAIWKDFVQQQS